MHVYSCTGVPLAVLDARTSTHFPAGPVTPKPEKDVTNAAKRHKRTKPRTAARAILPDSWPPA